MNRKSDSRKVQASRRVLYRESKAVLYRALSRQWRGSRASLRSAIANFLRRRDRAYLGRVVSQRAVALAVAGFLLVGTTIHASPPIELSDVAAGTGGFVINGITNADRSGRSVSNAGDVNGDGLADVIVGASQADPGNVSKAGESYVVFGKASSMAVELSSIAAGIGGFIINGIDLDDESGFHVSGAGDVNGDGLDDLIVGAFRADPNGKNAAGESYVVFGKAATTAVSLSDIVAGTGGFVINGIDSGDGSGISVSNAGDVNGDGLDDLIVGAYRGDPGGDIEAGESYVVFGKASTTAVELSTVAAGTGGFVINGIDVYDYSGVSVSGAGDVNGDGLADLIVGAFRADPGGDSKAGESYVVFGKTTGTAVELSAVAAGSGGFIMNGIDFYDYSGSRVSGAGDVNGDGMDDLIVGAFFATPTGRFNAGESYVVFGKTTGTAVNLSSVASGIGGFIIDGADNYDRSGLGVSGAGDVNGDGLADVIIGAYGDYTGNATQSGESYVVFGKTTGTAVDLGNVIAGTGGFVMNGIDADDKSGIGVSEAGDVNGDGLADVIIGAFEAAPDGRFRAGESYVVFSPETPPSTATYKGFAREGDGAGGTIVPELELHDARFAIDFSDEDTGHAVFGDASLETVTLHRSNAGITNFPVTPAGVYWEWSSNRILHTSSTVTLKYVAAEVAGLGVPESQLQIFSAPAASGPWTELPTIVDANKNELTVTVGAVSNQFFAIGQGSGIVWVDFAHGGTEVGTESLPFDSLGEALLATPPGGEIKLKGDTADNNSGETLVINQAVTLTAVGGTVRIGTL